MQLKSDEIDPLIIIFSGRFPEYFDIPTKYMKGECILFTRKQIVFVFFKSDVKLKVIFMFIFSK